MDNNILRSYPFNVNIEVEEKENEKATGIQIKLNQDKILKIRADNKENQDDSRNFYLNKRYNNLPCLWLHVENGKLKEEIVTQIDHISCHPYTQQQEQNFYFYRKIHLHSDNKKCREIITSTETNGKNKPIFQYYFISNSLTICVALWQNYNNADFIKTARTNLIDIKQLKDELITKGCSVSNVINFTASDNPQVENWFTENQSRIIQSQPILDGNHHITCVIDENDIMKNMINDHLKSLNHSDRWNMLYVFGEIDGPIDPRSSYFIGIK